VWVALACDKGPKADAHSTLGGVYSAEQAKRGGDIYGINCASCHASLNNHTGPVFRARWAGYTVADLFLFVRENMPKNDPGALTEDEYLAVVAYLLKLNDMPVGNAPLTADTVALKAILIDTVAAKH
jgi:mono/diheme cytochrome c family protein